MPSDPSQTESLDRKTFSILIREHQPTLMVYARALVSDESTAADLVQESFVAAWKNLSKFDVSRDFSTWMRGILRNKWRDHCRKVGRRKECSDEALDYFEEQLSEWEEERQHEGSPVFARLEFCLKKLPESLAKAISAFYYQELDGADAATHLDINPATLRKRLQRARSGLKQCLES